MLFQQTQGGLERPEHSRVRRDNHVSLHRKAWWREPKCGEWLSGPCVVRMLPLPLSFLLIVQEWPL